MKRKYWLLTLPMALILLLATACGGSSNNESASGNNDGDGDKETIEFWTMQLQPDFTDLIEDIISDFEEENPDIEVDWLDVPADDLEEKILTAVSSDTAPDVANLNPTFASKLADMDALVDMEEELSDDEQDIYVDGAWEGSELNGITFGLPWYLSTTVYNMNTEIYEDAGLDPDDPPETFEEAKEDAEVIKDETGKYGLFTSLDLSLPLQYMGEFGVDLLNDDETKAAFNTEDGLHVFEYFTDLYQDELIPKEALTEEQREGIDMYSAGEVGIFADFLEDIKENAKDTYEVTKPIESLTGGDSDKSNISLQNLVIPEQTDHKDAAVKFAKFVTNDDNQLEFAKESGQLPGTKEALDDDYFDDIPDDPEPTDEVKKIGAEQLREGAELMVPPMDHYDELKDAMYDAMSKAMLDEASPQEALDEAEDEWNEILAE